MLDVWKSLFKKMPDMVGDQTSMAIWGWLAFCGREYKLRYPGLNVYDGIMANTRILWQKDNK